MLLRDSLSFRFLLRFSLLRYSSKHSQSQQHLEQQAYHSPEGKGHILLGLTTEVLNVELGTLELVNLFVYLLEL